MLRLKFARKYARKSEVFDLTHSSEIREREKIRIYWV